MIRLLGSVMILLACGYGGIFAGDRLKRRVRMLRGVQQGLLLLEQEIEYSASMERAFRSAAPGAGESAALFDGAADLLSSDRSLTAGEAWMMALEHCSCFCRADKEVLKLIASGLGTGDRKGQAKSLELCRIRLYGAEQQASEEERQWGRLWRTLGWSLGAMVILIVL